MRKQYHWSLKLVALLLVFFTAAAAGICGISAIFNINYDMYQTNSLAEKKQERIEERVINQSYETALYLGHEYLLNQRTGSDPQEKEAWRNAISTYWGYHGELLVDADYTIIDSSGQILAIGGRTDRRESDYVMTIPQTVILNDGIVVNMGSALSQKEYPAFEDLPSNYIWTDFKGEPLPGLDSRTRYYEFYSNSNTLYRIERFEDLTVTVELKLTQADVDLIATHINDLQLMELTWKMKEFDIPVAIANLLLLLAAIVYLGFAAGKKPDTLEIMPRGLNRIPVDLSLILWGSSALGLYALGIFSTEYLGRSTQAEAIRLLMGSLGLWAGGIALCGSFFLTALCAQVRMGGFYWLKKTVIGRSWRGCWNLTKKIGFWFWNLMAKVWSKIWGKAQASDLGGKAAASVPKFGHMLKSTYRNLHLCWQWALLYGALVALTSFAAAVFWRFNGALMVLVALVGFLIVLYTSYGFAKLRNAAKRMSQGDLNTKIDTYEDFLYGNFAQFAEDLNALGDTCIEAAMEKMKSERMKSELITNVSHDIKTPLTSIINYVDLLQKTDSEEDRKEYLQVLERQSQRLKKLIEDLMEMSKASSGNIVVELAENDIIEAVNQALGEFSDRLENLGLQVIFRQSHQSIYTKFDGKLLWRVLSNILSNVVKYALPSTRVYADVEVADTKVLVSIKNISRESLNISAEELMERFVRGDESRNSEGNGLGLNIARSLMEVQGGDLQVSIDGDLFKVILTLG